MDSEWRSLTLVRTRFRGILVDGLRPYLLPRTHFASLSDYHAIVLPQAREYLDSIAGCSPQFHLPLFHSSLRIHNQDRAARTVSRQRLNSNRQRIALLFEDKLRLRIHALLKRAVGILYID